MSAFSMRADAMPILRVAGWTNTRHSLQVRATAGIPLEVDFKLAGKWGVFHSY